jgi:hypothetical protein
MVTAHGRGVLQGWASDHDHIDLLPQHPERAIWAHEGREEFQGISPDAESLPCWRSAGCGSPTPRVRPVA